MSPPPYIEFNKEVKKPATPAIEGGEKKKALAPIPKNHAVFRMPPHRWEKSLLKEDARGRTYLVEKVWIHETK